MFYTYLRQELIFAKHREYYNIIINSFKILGNIFKISLCLENYNLNNGMFQVSIILKRVNIL